MSTETNSATGPAPAGLMSRIPMENDAMYIKWIGVFYIGPLIPSIFAIFIIITGQYLLNTWQGSCGYPLDTFISLVIVECYFLLIIYSWQYLGEKITIKFLGRERTILYPFQSMLFLAVVYLIFGVISFIIGCVGLALLKLGIFCIQTAPQLYSYTLFLCAVYWLAFFIIFFYVGKKAFGDAIGGVISAQLKGPSMSELEERIFRKKFNELDKNKTGMIANEDIPKLLDNLGVFVPEDEVAGLIKTFDPSNSGSSKFDAVAAWFKKLNASGDDKGVDGEDSDDEKGGKKK